MEDDGKTLPPDSDAPTLPGAGHPRDASDRVGAAEQTPPPSSSSDPTLADAPPSPAPISDSALRTVQLFPQGTLLGGRYQILRVLGEGGMGAVYQARDRELDRVIALKVIRPELAGNPAILQRFKQELILARHVTHKNVVRIYDLGEADGIKFITMEYIDGEDLRILLRERGKFSPAEAVKVMVQVCRALDAAHAEGVIHRDLKPQNVMRDAQGRIVVMDFGLARSLEATGMTQTGALVGTLEYMSPEQALGGELDQRSDLFALGLIFYELLTGKLPYKADTALASLMKRTQERAVPASQIDTSVPKPLSAIVSRCLERDPNHRYHSAREVLQQLEAWETNPGISPSALARMASSPSRTVQISLTMPQRRTWLWVAGVVLLVAVFFAVPNTRRLVFHGKARVETRNPGIPDLRQGKYVAVMPFRVLGDEKSLRYVADGLEEALSARLFQLQEVHVASSAAVDKVAATDQPLGKIARELGVNLILQGTVQGNADKLRITLDLEDVSGGRRVWGQEFSGVPQDLLTLEDQVYGNLVSALAVKPTNEELARGGAHPTENVDAYDLYLQGRDAMHGNQGPQETQSAIRFFESALKKDPNFALAFTGMADASLRMYRDTKDAIWAQKALLAAQQAERLNANLAEVHLSLGSVYSATGKTAQSIEELKRALSLTPSSDEAYRRLGDAYRSSGREQEAISAYQSAVTANPYYWYNHNELGAAYFQFGDTEHALQEYRRVTELASDNATGFLNIGAVYIRQGNWADSIPALQKALELQPDPTTYSNLGDAYFFLKRYPESVKMFEKAVELSPKDESLMGNLADAYRWSGQTQQANSTYDKAIALAYQQLQVNPRAADTVGDLAIYYAKKGDSAHGQQYIRQARSMDASAIQLIYSEAQVYALAGKQTEALKSLREAFQKGYPVEEARNDPEMGKLANLPEFTQLISEFQKKTN
jgi:tetratricopeptide (TPR) repeat protein/TolB-like protein/predicted Ser/Thr protein kinase